SRGGPAGTLWRALERGVALPPDQGVTGHGCVAVQESRIDRARGAAPSNRLQSNALPDAAQRPPPPGAAGTDQLQRLAGYPAPLDGGDRRRRQDPPPAGPTHRPD